MKFGLVALPLWGRCSGAVHVFQNSKTVDEVFGSQTSGTTMQAEQLPIVVSRLPYFITSLAALIKFAQLKQHFV